MTTNTKYIFDFQGTLEGNKAITHQGVLHLLRGLKGKGADLIVWTGDPDRVPDDIRNLVDAVWTKTDMSIWGALTGDVVYVDNDDLMLRAARRYTQHSRNGMKLSIVPAKYIARLCA